MKEEIAILIVEDCSVMQSVIKKTLSLIGICISRVDSAMNGLQGLKMIDKHEYDIIMIDLNMPEMDGMEMIDKLKHLPKTVDIPLLVVSADIQKSDNELFTSKNVKFIQKPFKPEELRNSILELMSANYHT